LTVNLALGTTVGLEAGEELREAVSRLLRVLTDQREWAEFGEEERWDGGGGECAIRIDAAADGGDFARGDVASADGEAEVLRRL